MKLKLILLVVFSLFLSNFSYSQDEGFGKYLTTEGHIKFFSHAPIEDIEADNFDVLSIVNLDNNEIAMHVLMKSFLFEKSLMQEHFNENYVESDKYPKAKFKGKISGFDPKNKNPQKVSIAGNLTIHGITRKIKISSILKMKQNKLYVEGYFYVLLKDYDIKVPQSTINNIAKSIKISFDIIHKSRKQTN